MIMRRIVIAATLCVMVLGLIYITLKPSTPPLTPISSLGGAFELVDHNGMPATDRHFLGKPALYFFGFTNCPDICPTTLYEMTQHKKALGKAAADLQIIFISVDPERDTPTVLKDYLQAFPDVIGLTGTAGQVEQAVKAFKVYAQKTPTGGADYTVDHTASVFAADAQGRIVMLIGYGEAPDMVRAKLKRLLE